MAYLLIGTPHPQGDKFCRLLMDRLAQPTRNRDMGYPVSGQGGERVSVMPTLSIASVSDINKVISMCYLMSQLGH